MQILYADINYGQNFKTFCVCEPKFPQNWLRNDEKAK